MYFFLQHWLTVITFYIFKEKKSLPVGGLVSSSVGWTVSGAVSVLKSSVFIGSVINGSTFNVSVFGNDEGSEVGTKEAKVEGAVEEGVSETSGVGIKGAGLTTGGGASESSTCRRLSSISSVSTNPLKFCLDLSLWRLMTVISRSGIVSGSWPDPEFCSPWGTSANGIKLFSSLSSS